MAVTISCSYCVFICTLRGLVLPTPTYIHGLPLAADLWGLTAGKFDHFITLWICQQQGKGVTFVHWEVRSTAGVRLLIRLSGTLRVVVVVFPVCECVGPHCPAPHS